MTTTWPRSSASPRCATTSSRTSRSGGTVCRVHTSPRRTPVSTRPWRYHPIWSTNRRHRYGLSLSQAERLQHALDRRGPTELLGPRAGRLPATRFRGREQILDRVGERVRVVVDRGATAWP